MSEFNIKLRSKYLSGVANVTVITPNPLEDSSPEDFYSSSKKYPVLWMLHGGRGCLADWITYNAVPRYAAERNVILVAPSAHNSDFNNQPEVGEGYYFYDFFIKELMPFIYNWFPASDKAEDNLISGNSMGAAATWRYGLMHPERFGYIAPLCNQPLDYSFLEKYRDLSNVEFRELSKKEKIPTAYGIDQGHIHTKELQLVCRYPTVNDFLNSIENTLPKFDDAAAKGKLPKIFLCGSEEKSWGSGMSRFKNHVEELGISNVTFNLYDPENESSKSNESSTLQRPVIGVHNSPFWEQSVEQFLEFAGIKKAAYTLA